MPSFAFMAMACILASSIHLVSASAIPRPNSEKIDTTAMLSARSLSTSGLSYPEKIILYVVAGVAGFLIVLGLTIGILRSRHHKACENQARGVTKAILKKIPIIQYDDQITRKSSFDGSVSDSDLDEKCVESVTNHTCPICTEDFVHYQMLRVLPCGHQYHMKCIEDWLQRASSCPVCRIDLKPKAQQKSTPTIAKTKEMTPDLEQGQTQTRHIPSLQDRIVEDLYGLR